MIVAVAEESRGGEHARQWIEQAGAQYWCLIDTEHRVADLYGMVNVPQAVWIDEAGRIVRPPENAGSTDHFRLMDRTTRTLAAEHQAARLAARTAYLDAVRDWVLTGRHALPADAASSRLPRITPDIALRAGAFPFGRLAAAAWQCRRGRCASGGGQPATSQLVEHVASGRRSGRGRQGKRRGVLAARAGARGGAVLSAAGGVALSCYCDPRGSEGKQSLPCWGLLRRLSLRRTSRRSAACTHRGLCRSDPSASPCRP